MKCMDISIQLLDKAADGAVIALFTIQGMIADRDERIFDSAILSRLEEMKTVIKLLRERTENDDY